MEEWKAIDNCSDYMVNNSGAVKNIKTGKMLKGSDRCGYIGHTLVKDNGTRSTFFTHILVAKAFVINNDPDNKIMVNHKDEDKTNPRADNLEWVTPKENSMHGTSPQRVGLSKQKPINEYSLDGKYIRTWKTAQHIAEIYGLSSRVYQFACTGTTSTAHGRQWRYFNCDNATNIAPITNTYVLKYNKNVSYDAEIPSRCLYTIEKQTKVEIYADKLDKIIQDINLPRNLKQDLKEIKEFLMEQCQKPKQYGKH